MNVGLEQTGDNDPDTLTGGIGDDTLNGLGGADIINGEDGNDELFGGAGDDTIMGGAGDDNIGGDEDNDSILGGDGDDGIAGSDGNDTLFGGNGGDFIAPGRGDDSIEGGDDGDFDQLVYFYDADFLSATAGISVTYSGEFSGTVLDFAGGTDSFTGISRIWGTQNADVFNGTSGDQQFAGFGGNDTFTGGEGEEDTIDYSRERADNGAIQGVIVDMQAGTATDAYGGTDTFSGIEAIRGNEFDDAITGDDARNTLRGNAGDDTLIGNGGDDELRGGDGNDSILGGEGGDFIQPGTGNDTINGEARGAINGWWNELAYIFSSRDEAATGGITAIYSSEFAGTVTDYAGDTDTFLNIDRIWGTDNADSFVGTDGEQRFVGFAGNDTFDGGAGTEDWIRYDEETDSGGTSGITVDLLNGTATDAFGDTDTLLNIENIRATSLADVLIGGNDRERLYGEDGDDTIIGNGGNDNIRGGDGDDLIEGGEGGDFLRGGRGNDTIDGGARGVLGESNTMSFYFTARSDGATDGIEVTFTSEFGGGVRDYAGDTDVFLNIDRIWGTEHGDVFTGTDGRQRLIGFDGDDTFIGGDGDDQVDYEPETRDADGFQGITVDLGAGVATDTFGDTDMLISIEDIRGSDLADLIVGDSHANDLRGEGGDDTISSVGGVDNSLRGGGGNDVLNAQGDSDFVQGGDGNDLITFTGRDGYAEAGLGSDTIIGGSDGYFSIGYTDLGESVVIDTGAARVELTGGDVDTLINIRNVAGGGGDDTIIGDDGGAFQEFFASAGNDFYDGKGGGRDWIIYDQSSATPVTVDFAQGTAFSTLTGTDSFINIEGVRGTSGADTFIGRAGDSTTIYQGLAGTDSYVGGSGIDRIDFSFDDNRGGLNAVEVDLQAGAAFDGFGNFERFSSIEQVTGTDFGDRLFGDQGDNALLARDGNDTLNGRDGDDFMLGGLGIDTITLGTGKDWVAGRVEDLDGDIITDFSFEDEIYVFDATFALAAANLSISGDQLLVDTDGDGLAEASMTLLNGYTGPLVSTGGDVPGTTATVFSIESNGIFTAALPEGDSGATDVTITITRSGDVSTTATVDVILQGTGVSPVDDSDITDPLNTPQTITFLPNETVKEVTITLLGDEDVEPGETLEVSLAAPTSDGLLPAEIEGGETFVLIVNDDTAATIRIEGGVNSEADPALEFTIERTGDTGADLVVNYAVRSAGGILGAEDGDLVNGVNQTGSITIPAGETQVILGLDIAADDIAELHDNVIVTILPDASWPADLSVDIREATGSIRNDDGIPPSIPLGASAASFGDPHIVTLDGLNYAFQAVGEFTLIEAVSGDPLWVQVRYQAVPGSDLVSQTEAVATLIGDTRVMVDITSADLIRIDGTALDLSLTAGGVDIGDGQLFFDGDTITIVYANGEQLEVAVADGFLNVGLSIGENRDVRGLLGNADGDTTNDLALPDGTVLEQPVSFEDLYGTYADAWRIDAATSLFDYAPGQTSDDFTDRSFPIGRLDLDDFPDAVVLEAEAIAVAAGITDPALLAAAVLDILVTGDTGSAVMAAQGAPDVRVTTSAQDAPLITAAVGIIAAEEQVSEGNDGTTAIFYTVYRTGDLSQTLSVDVSLGGSFSAVDVVGVTSGTLEFAASQAAQVIEIGIMGDTLFEMDDTLVMSLEVADPDVNIINASATTIVLNDDAQPAGVLQAGDNTNNTFVGAGGDDTLSGGGGDDRLTGGQGGDALDGGTGTDTAVFSGDQSSYTLILSPTEVTIQDRTRDTGTGTDSLSGIEFLDFDTGTFNLDIFDGPTGLSAEEFGAIVELYIAYFNRAPDALGLYYWGTEFSNGFSLPEMALSFFGQPETQATYAAVLDEMGKLDIADQAKVDAFVTEVYANVLGRAPDAPGFEYWTDQLVNNSQFITPDIFILSIIGGAKNPGNPTPQTDLDQAYLATKADLGAYFAVIKGMSDLDDAAASLALFDGTPDSVTATVAAIDGHFADALDADTGDFLMPLVGVIDDPFGMG